MRGLAELEAKGVMATNLEQKGEAGMDQMAIIPTVCKVEEISSEESSEGGDLEVESGGEGDSDEAGSDDIEGDAEGTSNDEDNDSNSDEPNERDKELRNPIKRYGGLPVIPKKSSKLEAIMRSRLTPKEWKEVEKNDLIAKNRQSSITKGINFTVSLREAARQHCELGPVGRGGHVLAELKTLNVAYKQIIIAAVNCKKDNEEMMKQLEAERTKASENNRLYEVAMQGLKDSSTSLSQDHCSIIAGASSVSALPPSGDGRSGKPKKGKLDGDLSSSLFEIITKKVKGAK